MDSFLYIIQKNVFSLLMAYFIIGRNMLQH